MKILTSALCALTVLAFVGPAQGQFVTWHAEDFDAADGYTNSGNVLGNRPRDYGWTFGSGAAYAQGAYAFSGEGGLGNEGTMSRSRRVDDGMTHDGLQQVSFWVRTNATDGTRSARFYVGELTLGTLVGTTTALAPYAYAAFEGDGSGGYTLEYRHGAGGTTVQTGLALQGWRNGDSSPNFQQLVFDFDTVNDTWGLTVIDDQDGQIFQVGGLGIIDNGGGTDMTRVNGLVWTNAVGGGSASDVGIDELRFTEIPEPSTLVATGLLGLALIRRRK